MDHEALRQALIETGRAMNACGLNQGRAGNLSARIKTGFLITPTGVPYEELLQEHLVEMGLNGKVESGQLKPSSEWRMHRDIFLARPEISAIIHVHSPYATALACARREIPAFHYMVAVAGGRMIPCAEYAPFGTQDLSDHVVGALAGHQACLMANHGMIALGASLKEAFQLAQEVEYLARLYCLSLQIGGPVILSDKEMAEVEKRFKSYGKQS